MHLKLTYYLDISKRKITKKISTYLILNVTKMDDFDWNLMTKELTKVKKQRYFLYYPFLISSRSSPFTVSQMYLKISSVPDIKCEYN